MVSPHVEIDSPDLGRTYQCDTAPRLAVCLSETKFRDLMADRAELDLYRNRQAHITSDEGFWGYLTIATTGIAMGLIAGFALANQR